MAADNLVPGSDFVSVRDGCRASKSNRSSQPMDCCRKAYTKRGTVRVWKYLNPGLVITAAHLTAGWTDSTEIIVHIAGVAFPASLVRQGDFNDVDIALFSVDQKKLPENIYTNPDIGMSSTAFARRSGHCCRSRGGDPISHNFAANCARPIAKQILDLDWRCSHHW